jgi:hypothetical protein
MIMRARTPTATRLGNISRATDMVRAGITHLELLQSLGPCSLSFHYHDSTSLHLC